jgi:hypothetical protein
MDSNRVNQVRSFNRNISKRTGALTEAQALYRASDYREVAPPSTTNSMPVTGSRRTCNEAADAR